jgi:rhodanese-related sulfurtransferase
VKSISVHQLAAVASPQVIDVREPFEYQAAHAPGALNIPLGEIAATTAIRTDVPVHVICQSGGRSARATEVLQARGFDAINVEGGTSAWVAAGLPTEPGR